MSPIFHPINMLTQSVVAQQTLLESIVGNEQGHAGELKLQWTNFPESWGVFVLIAVVAAVVMACLLYTSPSPRDLSTSRMPSSA